METKDKTILMSLEVFRTSRDKSNKLLYYILTEHLHKGNYYSNISSREDIMNILGIKKAMYNRILKQLVKRGLLIKQEGSRNIYRYNTKMGILG